MVLLCQATQRRAEISLTESNRPPTAEGLHQCGRHYSILHKIYGAVPSGEARYSPAKCIGCDKQPVVGNPDPKHVSTSYIERQNLTMSMSMRRFTRLTNGFSKKTENHSASVALYMMYYNYGRKHSTLGTSPAVKAGLTDHVWSVEEIVALLERGERNASDIALAWRATN